MGGCCSNEKPMVVSSDENDQLIKENLKLLSAICMHYADMRNEAMVIKIMNVKSLTKEYYLYMKEERQSLIDSRHELEGDNFEKLETALSREKSELKKTNQNLKQIFSVLIGKFFLFSNPMSDYILDFKSHSCKLYAYESYKRKFLSIKSRDKPFENLHINQEDKRVLSQICHLTSYIASNKMKRVHYSTISPKSPKKYYSIRSVSSVV